MDFEFETNRTALANAFAAAGADWLGYMGMTDTVVAAIPDTQPQKYAVAGTLKGILSMAGKMMGEDGVTGLEELTRYDDQSGACLRDPEGEYVKFADVERLLAAPAAGEKPKLEDIEQYRMQMAAIGVASLGYWREGDTIHQDYDTVPLRDVAKLYAKYEALHKADTERTNAVSQPAGDLTDDEIFKACLDIAPEDYGLPGCGNYKAYEAAVGRAAIAAYLARQPKAEQPDTDLLGAIARGWCAPECSDIEMDSKLAFAIGREVSAHLARQAQAVPEGWEGAAKWLMNHYQDYANIDGLCKAMVAAAPAGAQNAEAIRNAVLEEAANALDLMNDSAGDRAAHEHREMLCCETERMWALANAAKAIRTLQTGSANTQEGGAA